MRASEALPWMSADEIAGMNLPGMPGTKRGVQERVRAENWLAPDREGKTWRRRSGRGGGYEFTPYSLPLQAQAALMLRLNREQEAADQEAYRGRREREDLWRRYEALPDRLKERAKRALRIVDAVEALALSGVRKTLAVMQIARMEGVSVRTINNWYTDVRGLNRCDWLPALAPHYARSQDGADCPEEAWQLLKADYLRPERPGFAACYRRLQQVADARGWSLPSAKTLDAEISQKGCASG